MNKVRRIFSMAVILCMLAGVLGVAPVYAADMGDVLITEISWMGTTNSSSDEWIELYNTTGQPIDVTGWNLYGLDGTPDIVLSGTIPAGSAWLLERTDDSSVPGVQADQIYVGALGNTGEYLQLADDQGYLIDVVDQWHAGDNDTKATMTRTTLVGTGDTASVWATATAAYDGGLGTPGLVEGSNPDPDPEPEPDPTPENGEQLNNVSDAQNAINVYFNKSANTAYASAGNKANYHVNLEDRLIHRINGAQERIDVATYEINLPGIVDALVEKAAQGVDVRLIADAKDSDDPHYAERYKLMRVYLEKMLRGKDGTLNTNDDIVLFSDSPIFAVEDSTMRSTYGLPAFTDLRQVSVMVGTTEESGRLLADGEEKSAGSYYSPGNQMHNKFLIIDGEWVWTGSWNFTVTGLYGSDENRAAGVLDGNAQHSIEVRNSELATIYTTEFEEMWGSATMTPSAQNADFHGRKTDNTSHVLQVGNRTVEVYFSPGDDAMGKVVQKIEQEADYSTYFEIFAWSDQDLVDALKVKWEGSEKDNKGRLTGFDVRGVFDSSFWNQWWSASVDMTGRTASRESTNNPNTRWKNPAPVYKDSEARKLHSKTLIVDAGTNSDPFVVVGSTNWSTNGNDINDENLLVIYDADIVNQFVQEFADRYTNAGGTLSLQ